MNTKTKGNKAEEKACKFLEKKGFKILRRNFYFKGGEIDIIALKNNTIHFIEVKSGNGFEPIYNITPSKLQKIIKGAYTYIQKENLKLPFCIDAIIIKDKKIDFLENLTL